ncbi:conserved hypothetical protein [Aeromonas phage 65]|uniref:Uncharacterized protein n=2 Tax=Ishigurovirus osborne TaxID=260149 RepID=A0A219YCA8_9CAUD|nr:hypothetical protein ST65p256 [Aeromonas phage 65]ADQ53264.1 conserved hypothetical protein [Aeromonas phage 65]APU01638.1 hypothetical protein [Aeromonas phage 65.2]
MFDNIVKFVTQLEKERFIDELGNDEYKVVMDYFYTNPFSPLCIKNVRTKSQVRRQNFLECFHVTNVRKRLIETGDENSIWTSGYRHMYNQILHDHYGDVIVAGHPLRDIIDVLNQVRHHFRFKGNSFNLISKMMVNSFFVAIRDLTNIIDDQFYVLVKEKFDRTVAHIKASGGYPIFCELDHFIYASPELIKFETDTHNDKLINIMIFDDMGYVSNVAKHQSRRVRSMSVDNEKHLNLILK